MSGQPTCAGTTQAGNPCGRTVIPWMSEDGRRWCSSHRPADAVLKSPERPICAGTRRDGSPCPTRSTTTVEIEGKDVPVCGWHLSNYEETGSLIVPPKVRQQKRPDVVEAEAIEEEEEEARDVVVEREPVEVEDAPASGNGHTHPSMTIRERVTKSAADSYEDIEKALHEALRNASKPRRVACPACHERFMVTLPDHAASLGAARLLLELVVSRPKPPEVEQPIEYESGVDYSQMSDEELRRLAFGE